jgi:hypothetical protein
VADIRTCDIRIGKGTYADWGTEKRIRPCSSSSGKLSLASRRPSRVSLTSPGEADADIDGLEAELEAELELKAKALEE